MFEDFFDDCLQINPTRQTFGALKPLPTCKGVVFFTDDNDAPIQLLVAANIRRTTAYRLFPQGLTTAKKRADVSQITRKIYYCTAYNDFKADLKHYQIARAIFPKTYNEISKLPRQTYVKINPTAKWPFFLLTNKPSISNKRRKVFGLFPTRKAAAEFIQILQNAFCLCQRPGLLATGQKAASCPYLQMNSCGAPCIGKITRAEYLRQINDAISAAGGNIEALKEKLQGRMGQLSHQRAFEQAQSVKKQLSRLQLLGKQDYYWTGELSGLAILHIDRSAKIASDGKRKKVQTYSVFLIKPGRIAELGDFGLENTDLFYESFLALLSGPADCQDPKNLSEQLSLLAWNLYRNRPAGVWFNCSKMHRTPAIMEIKNAILERFE
jgi:excinuclease UvrABC nuclease subunit